jgi:hypothetical protein
VAASLPTAIALAALIVGVSPAHLGTKTIRLAATATCALRQECSRSCGYPLDDGLMRTGASAAPSPLAHPVGEEPLPGPAAHGLLRSQVGAGPEHAGGLARQPDRHDQPTPMTGPQVAAEQLGYAVCPRSAHVQHQAGRLVEGELDEPGRS